MRRGRRSTVGWASRACGHLEAFQFVEVVIGELAWASGDGFGVQTMRFSGHASARVNGGDMDAENACEHGGGLALLDEFHGTTTVAFEFGCCSLGSHDGIIRVFRRKE